MKVLITGGYGFLGWHLRARARALYGWHTAVAGRAEFSDLERLNELVRDADVVIHLAAVNRAPGTVDLELTNAAIASTLAAAVRSRTRPLMVVNANSIQAEQETPYGRGKRKAAQVLSEATTGIGGTTCDVILPNLFGEHGSPFYNSFIATFCTQIAAGETPIVESNRPVNLLHVQRAAAALLAAVTTSTTARIRPQGETWTVEAVKELLQNFHTQYAQGVIPELSSDFHTDLFNTYRSYTFPQSFPRQLHVHSDNRGRLFETLRSSGGAGQCFTSFTHPGQTRGLHYHLRKIERFCVLRGRAEIALRKVLTNDIVRLQVDGADPTFVDMPTMWVHSLRNTGTTELITQFWTDSLLTVDNSDTFWESVELSRGRQP